MLKKLFGKKKILTLFTLAVSVFGVIVCGVSTAAWFEIATGEHSLGDLDNNIVSGTSDVNITGVTGYKYTYDELGNNNTDYSNGHITAFTVTGTNSDTSFDGNIHQGDITVLDVPEEGIGYYIVGNEKFCELNGFDTANAWKYSASIRLDNDSFINTDKARALNQVLYATSYSQQEIDSGIDLEYVEFKIRHHYIDSSGTQDVWMETSGKIAEHTEEFIELANGNWRLKNGCSANYDIYLNASSQIALNRLGNAPSNNALAHTTHLNTSKLKRSASTPDKSSYVFLKDTGDWGKDNAILVLYCWYENGGGDYNQYHFVFSDWGNTSYKYVVLTYGEAQFNHFILLRYSPTSGKTYGPGWPGDDFWNRTNNQDFQTIGDVFIESGSLNSWGNLATNTSLSSYASKSEITGVYTPGYYIMFKGEITIGSTTYTDNVGDGFHKQNAILLDAPSDTNKNYAQKMNVVFTQGTKFKVKYINEFDDLHPNSLWCGYHNSICTDMSLIKTVNPGDDVQLLSECKMDLYLNKSNTIYLYPRLSVYKYFYLQYKTYSGSNITTNYMASSPASSSEEIAYNSNYNAGTPTAPTNTTWCNTWYQSYDGSSTFSSPYSTTALTDDKNLYTYFVETEFAITLQIFYTANDGSTKRSLGGTNSTARAASKHSTVAISALNIWDNELVPDSHYNFKGYYWAAGSIGNESLGSKIESAIPENTFTSAKTIYVVYEPKEYDISYTYKYFDQEGNAIVPGSGGYSSETAVDLLPTSGTARPFTDFVPYTIESIPKVWVKKNASSTDCFRFFVFEAEGWYTDAGCQNEYTATQYEGNSALYCKMVAVTNDDFYVDTGAVNWSNPYITVFNDSDMIYSNSVGLNEINTAGGKVFTNNNYLLKVALPSTYNFIINNGSSWSENYNKTGNISVSERTYNTVCYVYETVNGYNERNHGWGLFYQFADLDNDINDDGTYDYETDSVNTGNNYFFIVGELGDTSTYNWTFQNSIQMRKVTSAETASSGPMYGTGAKFIHDDFDISVLHTFQIWSYNPIFGRTETYQSSALDTDDDETMGIVEKNGNNIKVRDGVSGTKFSIYLTDTNKIRILDKEKDATLYFSNELEKYSKSEFKLGYGDFDNNDRINTERTAVYERGICITQNDLDNNGGTINFIVRCKNRGSYKWYCYNGLNGGGADKSGLNGNPSFIVDGGLAGSYYGDSNSQSNDSYKMYAINSVGYYAFYVLQNGTISVAEIPAEHGEGFYVMPSSSNDSTETYNNGKKMKVLTNSDNVALFTCYAANSTIDNMTVYIRGFLGGKDYGLVTVAGNNVYNSAVDPASKEETALATFDNATKEITFKNAGSYNIYVYRDGNSYGVSITEYTSTQFFTMNSIRRSATTPDAEYVKKANTSFVLKVDFTLTNTAGFTSKACVDKIVSGTGIGDALVYTYAVDSDITAGSNCYDYMRTYYYSSLSSSNAQESSDARASITTGSHTLYILIDYNPASVNSLAFSGNALLNNFFFVIRLKQEV